MRTLAWVCLLLGVGLVSSSGQADEERARWAVRVLGGAALDNPALAVSLGGHYAVTDDWLLGVDGEWNPWASLLTGEVRQGTLNAYITTIYGWNVRSAHDHVRLRTTARIGTSTLLFDLYGAPAGSTGPVVRLGILGFEWKFSEQVRLIVDPADVVFPMPQTHGAPLTYRQYRLTLGLEWWP